MARIREWIYRLWGTVRSNPRDADLEAELRLHLELAAEDVQRRRGATEDAVRAARLRAGGVSQAMEALRINAACRGWQILCRTCVTVSVRCGAARGSRSWPA